MELMKTNVIEGYKNNVLDILQYSFPTIKKKDIYEALEYSINKRFNDSQCEFYNNYKNAKIETSLLGMANAILNNKFIMTSYGTLYNRHENIKTPTYRILDIFINARSKFKKEMFKYPKGTEEFKKYEYYVMDEETAEMLKELLTSGAIGMLKKEQQITY